MTVLCCTCSESTRWSPKLPVLKIESMRQAHTWEDRCQRHYRDSPRSEVARLVLGIISNARTLPTDLPLSREAVLATDHALIYCDAKSA